MSKKLAILSAFALTCLFSLCLSTTAVSAAESEPKDISNATVILTETEYTYDSTQHTPIPTVILNGTTLAEGDFTVSYSDNTNAGTATVTITGTGDYTGTATEKFTILPCPISSVKPARTSYVYNGNPKKPGVTVKAGSVTLSKSDYTVTYKSNAKAGEATVTVTAAENGNFTGTKTASFDIEPCALKKRMVTLSTESYIYEGSKVPAQFTVFANNATLKQKSDYTVSFKNNNKPGKATLVITGKKNYTGTISIPYYILPTKPNLVNAGNVQTDITLTWEQVGSNGVAGYEISRRKKGGSWKVLRTVSSKNNGSYTDKKAGKYNETYSYRVRAYIKAGSQKMWSKYSQTQSCKIQTGTPVINDIMPLSKTSMKLSWNKISDADGYYVLQKKGRKWKKIATIKSRGRTYYVVKGLKYGKAYTFALQTYRTGGGSTIKGSYNKNGYSEKLAWKVKRSGGYTRYYDATGKLITDVDGIIGKQSSYYLKVNKKMNVLTIYAKDDKGEYTVPVRAYLTSTGGSGTPEGTFHSQGTYRWHTLLHDVHGQWCTRIVSDVLFHSVWYRSEDNLTLSTVQYNKLGTTASAGCIRVNCEAAKWIYDNCKEGTTVTIYNSDNPGPFGKPARLEDLPSWHTWDPTDPNLQERCRSKGCH